MESRNTRSLSDSRLSQFCNYIQVCPFSNYFSTYFFPPSPLPALVLTLIWTAVKSLYFHQWSFLKPPNHSAHRHLNILYTSTNSQPSSSFLLMSQYSYTGIHILLVVQLVHFPRSWFTFLIVLCFSLMESWFVIR